jgi:cobalamin 5''-phosphate synthase/cobalamin synthase
MSALKGMFSFYTMIRLDITQKDMDDMDRKFCLAPIVGIFYGLLAVGFLRLFIEFLPLFPAAILTLFIIHAMNRFLHIDGTIDVGDGLVVSGTREDHLRALKDSRIGAGGMAFALFVIMLSVAAMSSLYYVGLVLFVPFVAEILAKNSTVSAAGFGVAGEGMAGNSVRATLPRHVLASTIISAVIVILYTLFISEMGWFDLEIEKMMIILFAVIIISIITGAIMSAIAKKNFGMVNGDVLGATNEISRAVTMLMMLALMTVV